MTWRARIRHNPLWLLLMFCTAAPISFVMFFIARYGVNVPVSDHWVSSVPIALSTAAGTLRFEQLAQPNNVHPIFFSKLTTALFTIFTRWNIRAELWVSFILALASLALLVLIFKDAGTGGMPAALALFAALVFSMRQYEVWLWSFQNTWYFVIMFFLAALWVLSHYPPGWRPLAAGAGLAGCALFALGSGLWAFPVLLGALWLFGYRKWAHFGFWTGCMLVGFGVRLSITGTAPRLTLDVPLVLHYTAMSLGSPFISYSAEAAGRMVGFSPALLAGALGLALFAANLGYLWRNTPPPARTKLAAWPVLAGFSVAALMTIGLGRAFHMEAHPLNPLNSPYVTHSTLFWAALAALYIHNLNLDAGRFARPLRVGGALLFAMLLCFYLWAGAEETLRGVHISGRYQTAKACMLAYPRTHDRACGHLFNAHEEESLASIEALAAYRLSAFAEVNP